MNSDLKAKWIAALRSGKYTQGQNTMRTADNKYCCLGVLCDVYGFDWELTDSENAKNGKAYGCAAGTDYIENDEALEVLTLTEREQKFCYSLNDGTFDAIIRPPIGCEERPHSFAEIADWIEQNIPAEVPKQ